jgi:hypothetical protein
VDGNALQEIRSNSGKNSNLLQGKSQKLENGLVQLFLSDEFVSTSRLKAKCFHPDKVEAFLFASQHARFEGIDYQTDTYFNVSNGMD